MTVPYVLHKATSGYVLIMIPPVQFGLLNQDAAGFISGFVNNKCLTVIC